LGYNPILVKLKILVYVDIPFPPMVWSEHIRKLLELISRLRREHTPRQGMFARKAGIDQTHYGQLETTATDIMLSTFLKICHALRIKIWLDTPWGFFTLLNPDAEEPEQPPTKQRGQAEKKKKKKKRGKELKDEFMGY
jgi:hypothetical protein